MKRRQQARNRSHAIADVLVPLEESPATARPQPGGALVAPRGCSRLPTLHADTLRRSTRASSVGGPSSRVAYPVGGRSLLTSLRPSSHLVAAPRSIRALGPFQGPPLGWPRRGHFRC